MLAFLFPVPLLARAHLLRACGLWLGVRVMLALVLLFSETDPMPDVVHLPVHLALYAVAVTAVLGLLDSRVRRETMFLATLGISRRRVALTFAAVAALLEVGVALTGHA